jgi:glycosyltransferase involved in cell wall biosynthesis
MQSNPPPPPWNRIIRSLSRIYKMLHILSLKKIDTVLIFSSAGYSAIEKGIMVYIAKIYRKKVVLSFRSGYIERDVQRSERFKGYLKNVLRKADIVLCQSVRWLNYYNDIFESTSKYVVIKNWVELSNCENPNRVDRPYINILYMASLNKNKGIYDLIESIMKAPCEFKDVRVTVCGEGPEYQNIVKIIMRAELFNIIKIKGKVIGEAKLKAFINSDIFVLPSYYEGMPNAILEAMACSKPIIATNVGAIPEVIINNTSGILFDPGNIDALYNALKRLVNDHDLRIAMGAAGRDIVEANHDVNKLWKNVYDVLIN